MSAFPPVRVAFLGCGFITAVHSRHLKALRADIVAGYASRDVARARVYCRRFGGAFHHASYEAALADPQIDAVVVAVPPALHRELTIQALAAGKHVLVEMVAEFAREHAQFVLAFPCQRRDEEFIVRILGAEILNGG